ncbi:MAG TPA: alpha/beta hydrolase [Oligoflexia bacterium]|nr:alpha/beta hydrolase [Oligoflexia bacterium]HMP47825.1 alpha/beta hydrolase [Oligoflexia bacterium]
MRTIFFDGWGFGCKGLSTLSSFFPGSFVISSDCEIDYTMLNYEEIHLAGWSVGGLRALKLYFMYPEKIRKITLISSTSNFIAGVRGREAALNLLKKRYSNPETRIKSCEDFYSSLLNEEAKFTTKPHIFPTMEDFLSTSSTLNSIKQIESLELLEERISAHELEKIKADVLVIHGLNDNLIPASHCNFILNHIPNATLIEIPDCGHLLPFTSLSLLNESIRNFLMS